LARDRAYLADLRARVGRVVEAGGTVEAALAACADMPLHLPEENAPYHRMNVESAYIELGGEADPRSVGWGREKQ
jgi:hypothetical protein